MAINFSVGEYVVISRAYVEKILGTADCGCTQQTLTSLGYIGANPSEVLATGMVFQNAVNFSYIRVRPLDRTNPAYRNNQGITIYFCGDTHLNNSLELSTAFIDDKCFVKAQNVSGSTITKGQLVYQSGFDGILQLPNITLASAAASTTSAVLGLASADILAGECGSILIEGSFGGLDTSGFSSVGQTVFLSDTPGAFSDTAGTVERVVAKATTLDATDGVILLDTVTPGTGGGGGGSQGVTGIQGFTGTFGLTGIQGTQGVTGISAGGSGGFFTDGTGTNAGIGKGATAPVASGDNALAQGNSAVASGSNTFAQGDNVTADGNNSFVQGYNNSDNGGANSLIQGYTNTITNGSYSLVQGAYNTLGAVGYGGPYSCMVQGTRNSFFSGSGASGGQTNVFAQGYQNEVTGSAYNVLLQGRGNYAYNYSYDVLVQGHNNYINSNSYRALAQGRYNYTLSGSYNVFVQGYSNQVQGRQVFIQGLYNDWDGSGVTNAFIQGQDIDFDGSSNAYQVFAQGRNHGIGGECTNTFIQGYSLVSGVQSENSFFQGAYHTMSSTNLNRVFIQGTFGRATLDDQKVWASNRTGTRGVDEGNAQSSKIIKAFTTADATTNDFVIPLDTDKSYLITVKAIARNTITNGESASFTLNQSLAYNDAGTAVLTGTPAFTGINSGGGAAAWAMGITTSTSNVLIQYTGDADDSVQWCIEIEMVEVAG